MNWRPLDLGSILSFGSFKCKKFGLLLSEREDRKLTPQEDAFMRAHAGECAKCGEEEAAGHTSLNMLRSMALDTAPPAPQFDTRLFRRAKLIRVKDGINYWSPAFVGGAIACIALFATLHVLTLQPSKGPVSMPNGEGFPAGEARLDRPAYPALELQHLPRLTP